MKALLTSPLGAWGGLFIPHSSFLTSYLLPLTPCLFLIPHSSLLIPHIELAILSSIRITPSSHYHIICLFHVIAQSPFRQVGINCVDVKIGIRKYL